MLVSSFCASRLRDATRRMSAAELVCAAPSQQQLRGSSISSVAAAAAGDGSVPRRRAVDGGFSSDQV